MLGGFSIPKEPDFTCPSGNCTWPPFDSLGFCSSCKNVTADLRTSCWLPNPEYHRQQSCNYTVGSAWTLSAEVIVQPEVQTVGTTTNATIPEYTEGVSDTDTNNSSIIILRIGQDQYNAMSNHSKLEDLDVTSHECSFSFCRKTYAETTVVNGALRETVPVQYPFSLKRTLYFDVPLVSCDMWPGEEGRPSTHRTFRVFSGENDSPKNTAHIEDSFKVCPDIKAIRKDTSSYITSLYETRMVV